MGLLTACHNAWPRGGPRLEACLFHCSVAVSKFLRLSVRDSVGDEKEWPSEGPGARLGP